MTDIFFDGGDGKVIIKKLTIIQRGEYVSYTIETVNGVVYSSPLFKSVK